MLSMKTLRVAFAAAAAALLLGSGLASATVQHLDGTSARPRPRPPPLAYAQELLGAGTNMTEITYAATRMHKLVADLGERIEGITTKPTSTCGFTVVCSFRSRPPI